MCRVLGCVAAAPLTLRHELLAADNPLIRQAERHGRIFNVHIRRATMGGLAPENTHPFCLGEYSFCHNGTIVEYPRLLEPGVARPHGTTDSEVFFNLVMREFDPRRPVATLRRAVEVAIDRSPFSGLN